MQASEEHKKVIEILMKQKDDGSIPGIIGRLGDFGTIDKNYNIAILSACGHLDDIVVDTVDTALACIDFLKKQNSGRASFIALEKVEHLREKCGKINTPENVPRLIDLVTIEDERLIPAFYFALRDTLVAKDLEQGNRIVCGLTNYRAVTLMGEIVETSETMHGGNLCAWKNVPGPSIEKD